MKKHFSKYSRKGLPGGANEQQSFTEGFIVSKRGQWDFPGKPTMIPDANGSITTQGVKDILFGFDDQGNSQIMYPDGEYQFPGNHVFEIPLPKAQMGIIGTTSRDKGYSSRFGSLNPFLAYKSSDKMPYAGVEYVKPLSVRDPQLEAALAAGIYGSPEKAGVGVRGSSKYSGLPVGESWADLYGGYGTDQGGYAGLNAYQMFPLLQRKNANIYAGGFGGYELQTKLPPGIVSALQSTGTYFDDPQKLPFTERLTPSLRYGPAIAGNIGNFNFRFKGYLDPYGKLEEKVHTGKVRLKPSVEGSIGYTIPVDNSKKKIKDQIVKNKTDDLLEEAEALRVLDQIPKDPEEVDFVKQQDLKKKMLESPQKETRYRFQEGGEAFELELTDEEIEQYKKGGYIVEELPKAQVGESILNVQEQEPQFKVSPQQIEERRLNPYMYPIYKGWSNQGVKGGDYGLGLGADFKLNDKLSGNVNLNLINTRVAGPGFKESNFSIQTPMVTLKRSFKQGGYTENLPKAQEGKWIQNPDGSWTQMSDDYTGPSAVSASTGVAPITPKKTTAKKAATKDIPPANVSDATNVVLPQEGLFKYSGRPEATYKKDANGNWLISLPSTKGEYIPIKDPTGKRTAELNKNAYSYDPDFTQNASKALRQSYIETYLQEKDRRYDQMLDPQNYGIAVTDNPILTQSYDQQGNPIGYRDNTAYTKDQEAKTSYHKLDKDFESARQAEQALQKVVSSTDLNQDQKKQILSDPEKATEVIQAYDKYLDLPWVAPTTAYPGDMPAIAPYFGFDSQTGKPVYSKGVEGRSGQGGVNMLDKEWIKGTLGVMAAPAAFETLGTAMNYNLGNLVGLNTPNWLTAGNAFTALGTKNAVTKNIPNAIGDIQNMYTDGVNRENVLDLAKNVFEGGSKFLSLGNLAEEMKILRNAPALASYKPYKTVKDIYGQVKYGNKLLNEQLDENSEIDPVAHMKFIKSLKPFMKKEEGGQVLELTPEEIQWYLDNGYNVDYM